MKHSYKTNQILRSVAATLLLTGLASCGGGGGGSTLDAEEQSVNRPIANETCSPNCFLETSDVEKVLAQAVAEATKRDEAATIAVVDRVGNVLAVYQMRGADNFVTITSTFETGGQVVGGLENINFIPATLAAISKAVTGAYLSTSGNAFTTRTAGQIIQENFNPGEQNVPSGPLFGVQFSQLPCSDFSNRADDTVSVGPFRSPLGLSADPGGFPLYKEGIAVGGVGVIADGIYGLDKNLNNFDTDIDELIAVAAMQGYAAPTEIRADQITIVGKTARFSDSFADELLSSSSDLQPFDSLNNGDVGSLTRVIGYFDGTSTRSGTVFGNSASGIRPADPSVFVDGEGNSLDAFVFVDSDDNNRYPARAASDAPGGSAENAMTEEEVQALLNEAIDIANLSRAQIRVPVGTQARVTISVVDSNGEILGMARTRDGPVFGADVSLQKARTATFFSGTGRLNGSSPADLLRGLPAPKYLASVAEPVDGEALANNLSTLDSPSPQISDYVSALQDFLGVRDALEATGEVVAFADRSGGNLSRPNYPDGPSSGPPGPLSKPPGEWSVFSVGLQLDLVYNSLINHVAFVLLEGGVSDTPQNCTGNTGFTEPLFGQIGSFENLANGMQIFPGSVPIFRGNILIGGIGVSGDGVDQDDMISFLGVHRAGVRLNTGLGNAPAELRADKISIPNQTSRLRYISCPQLPFIDSSETAVCDGL